MSFFFPPCLFLLQASLYLLPDSLPEPVDLLCAGGFDAYGDAHHPARSELHRAHESLAGVGAAAEKVCLISPGLTRARTGSVRVVRGNRLSGRSTGDLTGGIIRRSFFCSVLISGLPPWHFSGILSPFATIDEQAYTMQQAIRIAILDCVPEVYWADDLGITDSQKFVDLLQPFNTAAQFDTYYSTQDQFPQSLDAFDAILVTGSPCSVHDQLDWIMRMMDLIRQADAAGKRIIASCFGHQLVAKTFGGEVGFNEQGWMIGNYPIAIEARYAWMQPAAAQTGLYHFNQERVTRLPAAAKAFARSEAYDAYAYTLGDNILCLQGHPEQPLRAMRNFLRATPGLSEAAIASAEKQIEAGEPDAATWAAWMMRFYLD